MNEYELYKRAIEHWGAPTQAMMAVGEMNELSAELVRCFIQGRENLDNMISEVADVEIMLAQLRCFLPTDEVNRIKKQKLKRLEDILDRTIEHQHFNEVKS